MKFAYADPPYIGQAKKHYRKEQLCQEVNHQILINSMVKHYDGWALSCSSPSLQEILSYCPTDVRVMAWVKPFAAFKKNVNPAYAWEPVIIWHSRKRTKAQPTVRDWISCPITMQKNLSGAKPESFCYWLFEVLNLMPDDELEDLFPGTGIVMKCWQAWKTEPMLKLKYASSAKPSEDQLTLPLE